MVKVQVSEIRDNLAEFINRAAYRNERQIIERHGKPVAALVSVEDVELLQILEDLIDIDDARKALAAWKEDGTVPWKELKSGL